jgi:hypothetical protein
MRGTFTAVSLILLFSFSCSVLTCIASRKDGGANIITVISSRRVLPNFEAGRTPLDPAATDEVIELPLAPLFIHAVFTTAILISFTWVTLCADNYHGGII